MIAHIILNISDPAWSFPFYDRLMANLGFHCEYTEVDDADDSAVAKSYRKGEHNIWLKYDKNRKHERFVRDIGLDHIAFKVDTQSQVDELHRIVGEMNVEITRIPKSYPEYSSGYYAFYFRDPDGIPLEIMTK